MDGGHFTRAAVLCLLIAGCAAAPSPGATPTAPPAQSVAPTNAETPRLSQAASVSPAPKTALLTLSGKGHTHTKSFSVSGDSVDLAYTFDCRSVAADERYLIVTFLDSGGVAEVPVSVRGVSGHDQTTVELTDKIGPYALGITTYCTWSVTIIGKP